MEYLRLSIPLACLVLLAGIKHYFLATLLPSERGELGLHLSHYQRTKWYKWFLREFKDLVVVGLLLALISHWLYGVTPWISIALLALLSALALAQSGVLLVLVLAKFGYMLPNWLCSFALAVLLFPAKLTKQLRATSWGGGFLLSGIGALLAWLYTGKLLTLLLGYCFLVVGIASLLWGVLPSGSEDCIEGNWRDAGR